MVIFLLFLFLYEFKFLINLCSEKFFNIFLVTLNARANFYLISSMEGKSYLVDEQANLVFSPSLFRFHPEHDSKRSDHHHLR